MDHQSRTIRCQDKQGLSCGRISGSSANSVEPAEEPHISFHCTRRVCTIGLALIINEASTADEVEVLPSHPQHQGLVCRQDAYHPCLARSHALTTHNREAPLNNLPMELLSEIFRIGLREYALRDGHGIIYIGIQLNVFYLARRCFGHSVTVLFIWNVTAAQVPMTPRSLPIRRSVCTYLSRQRVAAFTCASISDPGALSKFRPSRELCTRAFCAVSRYASVSVRRATWRISSRGFMPG